MKKSNARQPAKPWAIEITFGQLLHTQRSAKGYSLTELARILKVTKGYLSKLEAGKTRPSWQMVQRIAETLKMDSQ